MHIDNMYNFVHKVSVINFQWKPPSTVVNYYYIPRINILHNDLILLELQTSTIIAVVDSDAGYLVYMSQVNPPLGRLTISVIWMSTVRFYSSVSYMPAIYSFIWRHCRPEYPRLICRLAKEGNVCHGTLKHVQPSEAFRIYQMQWSDDDKR